MHQKANILVMVVFIMFISSLGGLLVTKYVKSMISYSGEFYKYYKAYYIAYGGVELELTKVINHGFGFDDEIDESSDTVKRNFNKCFLGGCYFNSSIKSTSNIINIKEKAFESTGCDYQNAITLKSGQGVIIPLFKDQNTTEGKLTGENYINMSTADYANIKANFYDISPGDQIAIGVIDELSGEIKTYTGGSNPETIGLNTHPFHAMYNDTNKSYLIFVNQNTGSVADMKICLESMTKLVAPNIVINSNGKFFDRVVSLEVIKQNTLPEYLLYTVIGH